MFNDDNQSLFSNMFLLMSSKKPDDMTPESCEPLKDHWTARYDKCLPKNCK